MTDKQCGPECNTRPKDDSKAAPYPLFARRALYAAALEAADYRPDMQRGDLADTVLDVRDTELQQLRDQLERAESELNTIHHADSADAAAGSYAHRAERAEAELRRLRDTNQQLVAERVDAEEGVTAAVRRAKHEEQRALRAEAAIARARGLAAWWTKHRQYGRAAAELLATLNEPKQEGS